MRSSDVWRTVGEELGGGQALLQRCNLPEESGWRTTQTLMVAASQESPPGVCVGGGGDQT